MSTESRGPRSPERGLLEALVEAERGAMEPPEGAKGQTWKRVVASVAVGGPVPVEPSSVAGPAATAATPWVKIVLGVVLSGVVGVAAVVGYRSATDPGLATNTQRPPSGAPRVPSSPLEPAAARAEPSAPETPAALAPGRPTEPPPDAVPRDVSPPKTAPPVPSEPREPPASDLAEETRLLARARARLRSGSPRAALAPLNEHARRFPQGQLAEDRMVLRAQALCEAGDTEAGRNEASALRKAFPGSSHLPRVDRVCSPRRSAD